MTARLLLVGGGRMGEALLGGLLAAGWAEPADLAVVEVVPDRRAALEERFPKVVVSEGVVPADAAVIAVKPNDVEAACAALAGARVARVLSIAAGVPTARLEAALPTGTPVVRAMPNTPALVGAGAAAIAAGAAATEADLAWAESILSAVGTVVRVDERQLDAVTGVSGSGPAYVFRFAEALIAAGEQAGLPHDISVALTVQTLTGAARLLAESGEPPADLRAAVTSPGGTTAAALRVLDERQWFEALVDAVAAATARSRELGAG
ncbi:MAG TPA: pyrroline-5-carboxylate reductase [Acidimicrobiales bacterium]|nr:pyrroline-5-carboxylate reductase [Acidimicrobiales bacterium]